MWRYSYLRDDTIFVENRNTLSFFINVACTQGWYDTSVCQCIYTNVLYMKSWHWSLIKTAGADTGFCKGGATVRHNWRAHLMCSMRMHHLVRLFCSSSIMVVISSKFHHLAQLLLFGPSSHAQTGIEEVNEARQKHWPPIARGYIHAEPQVNWLAFNSPARLRSRA